MTASYLLGGEGGFVAGCVLAAAGNLFANWNLDRLVLGLYGTQQANQMRGVGLHAIVERLVRRAGLGLPSPDLYMIMSPEPDAFATGRNPKNATDAITGGCG